ncbi:hypothetical protein PMIT1313_00225 [Prochlorococcus marinus str. MIT 1313]|nr:hypothetical protein PMIT1313_00225 [Prochlorococcus marinus str. MIT 1313]KZR76921.1 hypothetical protein PMIT1318_00128 [Prochlorococcus marinus str. MIT 1318]
MLVNKAFVVVYLWTKINKTNAKNSDLNKARRIRLRVFHLNAMAIATNNLLIKKPLIRTTGSQL